MDRLQSLYYKCFGNLPVSIEAITNSGSNRQYYRLSDDKNGSVIGVVGTSIDENNAFIFLSQHFEKRKLPVPKIIAVSDDGMCYLQTDLGKRSLFDELSGGRNAGGRYNLNEKKLLINTIRELPNIQIRGARGLDWTKCYPQPEFDEESVMFDLNYFKYCFLKPTGIDFHELKLEANFRMMMKDLTKDSYDSFLYRDFQARNVFLDTEDKPMFIDYQGGRKGPFYYDVASFLWQASALYSNELRNELITEYYDSLKNYTEVPSIKDFKERLTLFVLFRIMQVLGAYGYRGNFEKKSHFIKSIPPAIDNLRDVLKEGEFPYPYLVTILQKICSLPQYHQQAEIEKKRADGYKTTETDFFQSHPADGPATFSKYDNKGELTVRVFSFSFHKGIPQDDSGNGGGYVFDCRSTHNPGRYEPYKQLTGLDDPVIRFLEDDGEILEFLKHVYALADTHVERYIKRGFTNLMFSFGCTGGQHRSVYAAQHLAEHINEKYEIEVVVNHREQEIRQVLPRKKDKNDAEKQND